MNIKLTVLDKIKFLTSTFKASLILGVALNLGSGDYAFAQTKTSNEFQSKRKISREADELFIDEVFKEALPIYLKLDQLKPQSAETNYRIGICYLHTEAKNKAIPYFLKAQEYDKKNEFEDINYYLGIGYHHALQFDKAIETFEKYKLMLNPKHDYAQQLFRIVNKYIANCKKGKALVRKPVLVNMENIGMKVNSASQEAYPVISPDEKTLYFSSKRIDMTGRKPGEDPDNEFEDIYVCTKLADNSWSNAKKVGKGLNSFKHDAPLYVSQDGKKLFFYRTDEYNSTDIYFIEYKDTDWSAPKAMVEINSPSWETGACLSPDGKTFYFSSDRPGGFGGMDIYYSTLTGSKWSAPKNIGPELNTEWDEQAPFLLADGKTLYFSSNGPRSMGGFDIFKSILDLEDDLWSVPQNVGFPINSPEDEVYITWIAEGNKGYLATNRTDSYGEADVYSVMYRDEAPEKPKFIASKDSIIIKNFALPKIGDVLTQKVYFDFNIAHNYAEFSKPKLQEVVALLYKFPEVKLEVGGHADNQGDPDINALVSQKRAETVFRYLVSQGISPKRLSSKSYSNVKLIINGHSTIENAPNRRVEFKVLQGAEPLSGKN